MNIALKIFELWEKPEVDILATAAPRQVSLYFSALRESEASRIDCFTQDWSKFKLVYVFPPPAMINLNPKQDISMPGEDGILENCPLGLSALFSLAGRKAHRTAMKLASNITPTIAKNMAWTRLHQVRQT